MPKNYSLNWLKLKVLSIARIHFYFALLNAVSIITFDAWGLATSEAVLRRWMIATALFVVTVIVWYGARSPASSQFFYKMLVFALILADIVMAAFTVYSERGMSSRAVMLFAVPIAVAAALKSRRALLATTALSAAIYATSVVLYFFAHPSEGYKIELYGTIGFYSGVFFVLAALLRSSSNQE